MIDYGDSTELASGDCRGMLMLIRVISTISGYSPVLRSWWALLFEPLEAAQGKKASLLGC